MRIAVIDRQKCKIKECDRVCIRFCPGVRTGDETIVEKDNKIYISEELCIGCAICVKKCPKGAITIINVSEEPKNMIHQYAKNAFRLYGLPIPVKGQVTGLLGANGIGKTTALNILSGKFKPNLGRFEKQPEDREIVSKFKGTELQNYMKDLLEGKIKAVYKPQQVDVIPSVIKGTPKQVLKDERGVLKDILKKLEIEHILDRELNLLSGGELQRMAIAAAIAKEADVYYFDEPSSYLDVRQRLIVAKAIRELALSGKAVLVVEHDLATLDFIADNIHIVYGSQGAYGVISSLYAAKRGINAYLDGYIAEENIRFRDSGITFGKYDVVFRGTRKLMTYNDIEKTFASFKMKAEAGYIYEGEIIGVFGANALGKTTFAKMLAGEIKPDRGEINEKIKIAYKPQYLSTTFTGTVRELLSSATREFATTEYKAEIIRPLQLEALLDNNVQNLSGGELQRVAIAIALSKDADFILLDEPSAYLDVEQRVNFAKLVRRFIEKKKKTCLIVDHDILLLNYVSDRSILFLGEPGKSGSAHSPEELHLVLNRFLKELGITFRKDPQTGRPRANKFDSQKDQEQKAKGTYFEK